MSVLFLIISFFSINRSTNNIANPYLEIDRDSLYYSLNNISYTLNINKNLDRRDVKIYDINNLFSGNLNYKSMLLFFNYKEEFNRVYYRNNDIKLKNNSKKDDLELKIGFILENVTLLGITNINFHSNSKIKYGAYLNYHFNINNIRYKIYFSKYEKQMSEIIYLFYKNDNFIFPYSYNNKFKIIGFYMKINDLLEINTENTLLDINTINLKKKGFALDEKSKINEFVLKMKFNMLNFLIYFNYFEDVMSTNIINRLDNTKFSKFIIKRYYDYNYNLGIIFKNIKCLNIDLLYQNINSYFYGNIEAWPFTDGGSMWIGGRINFSSKPKYVRYIVRVKNKFFFLGKIIEVLPEIFYDIIKIIPNTKTYEAGFLGLGKRDFHVYNAEDSLKLLHVSISILYRFNKLKLKLHLSQIIPILINTRNLDNKSGTVSKLNNLEGFYLNLSLKYNF